MIFEQWLQSRLITHSYTPGAIDGIIGSKTINAFKAFMENHHLNGADFINIGMALASEPKPRPALNGYNLEHESIHRKMTTSANGRRLIVLHEGNKLTAYRDCGGLLTIGVGHTEKAGPPVVTLGMTITETESNAILTRDLVKFENAVQAAVKVALSQNEFDALVSLTFNIGDGAFARSTLVKKLNCKDRSGAADQFLVWNKVGGQVVVGLTKRRQAERALFLKIT